MSNNYEDYKPLNPLPPRRRKNGFVTFTQWFVIVLLVIAIAGSAAFFVITHRNAQNTGGYPEQTDGTPETETNGPEETGEPDESGSENTDNLPPKIEYKTIEVLNDDVHSGSLSYISSIYKAVYPTNAELIKLYGNNENAYMLSSSDIVVKRDMVQNLNSFIKAFNEATGRGNIVIWTGYRTEDRQQTVYDDYVKKNGEAAAAGNVAKAGESDYHTGYTIGIRVKSGNGYEHPSRLDDYSWLVENCYKFGFIERYPSDKVSATGFSPDENSLCLRYVGAPHAEIMKQKNMCLEEYLTFIKDYKYDSALEFTGEGETNYGVYFVPETAEADNTLVEVPKESVYTIVGNNMDGFIVAYQK